jgi:pSer/pThr/pTyr-binding forkhead associated (FHA) protein
MPEQLLGLLKLCLLALLYLFFARVLWAVWTEVRAVRPRTEPAGGGGGAAPAAAARRAPQSGPGVPHRLTISQPAGLRGVRFALDGPELTIGRATGCHVSLPDDTFASTLHARAYAKDGSVYVEDLGSTNGTFVNGIRISAPVVLRPGDELRAGSTILEAS